MYNAKDYCDENSDNDYSLRFKCICDKEYFNTITTESILINAKSYYVPIEHIILK